MLGGSVTRETSVQSGDLTPRPMQFTRSLWSATTLPRFAPLMQDARADICVVGAGIAGLTTAYLAARAGRNVIVLDDGPVGGGESARTTAHLANAMDDRFVQLEKVHGEEGSRLAAESHGAAIDCIERIVADEGIECDFRRVDGYLFLGSGDDVRSLDQELEAARRAGHSAAELLPNALTSGFYSGPCIRFPRQAQFHPLRFLAGLTRCLMRDGARIHEGSHVLQVEDGAPVRVAIRDGPTVRAAHVLIATNSPVGHYLTTMKMLPYRTFAVALRIEAGALATALYWDTEDPYHYVRLQPYEGGEVLIVGGGDYQTGTRDEGEEVFQDLERWARERFSGLADVVARWSGQVLEPADHLAFIGRDTGAQNVYIATGDSGQGMTHGVIAGMLINDLIAGRSSAWEDLYSPARIKLAAAREYLTDAAKVSVRYLDYVKPAEVSSPDEIAPGQGAVLRRGIKPVAVYRDMDGTLHERSAICTHAGCMVHWNSTESSWDCPCHGSRFNPYGIVLNGPAGRELDRIGD